MSSHNHNYTNGYQTPDSPVSERFGRPGGPRRMTGSSVSRVPPPALPLGLPEPSSTSGRSRSPSPLRHSIDESNPRDDDRFSDVASENRPASIAGSMSGLTNPVMAKFASSFRNSIPNSSILGSEHRTFGGASANPRDSNIFSPPSVKSSLTDAELEAEALREKEHSRREAERILTAEADQRKKVEERVLAMLRPTGGGPPQLPPISPGQSLRDLPPLPEPPGTPTKETGSFLGSLMKKLTPTKDLTPAQQIINETKAREKEREKDRKKETKDREREGTASSKKSDPAFLSLSLPSSINSHSPNASPSSRFAPSSYGAQTPPRPSHPLQTGFSPTPVTPTPTSRAHGPSGASPILSSTPGEPTPLYAVFNPSGSLDIPGTLVTIARRFEKLEKWTVGHVRALEERMKDVEKYLIEREEKGAEKNEKSIAEKQLDDLKDELSRVYKLMNELRSEVAEYKATEHAPRSVAAPPAVEEARKPSIVDDRSRRLERQVAAPEPTSMASVRSPTESSRSSRSLPRLPAGVKSNTPAPAPAPAPTPPPAQATPLSGVVSPPPLSTKSSRSRLPYPSGDYTANGSGFSGTSSLSGSPTARSIARSETEDFGSTSPPYLGSPKLSTDLAPPKTPTSQNRATSKSPSPTPRKRYTIALSGREDAVPSPNRATRGDGELQTALFSDSPSHSRSHTPEEVYHERDGTGHYAYHGHAREMSDDIEPPERQQSPDPTIGRTSITLSRLSLSPQSKPSPKGRTKSNFSNSPNHGQQGTSNSWSPSTNGKSDNEATVKQRTPSARARAQSTFLPLDSIHGSSAPGSSTEDTPTKKPHRRAQSQGRYGLGLSAGSNSDSFGDRNYHSSSSSTTPSSATFVDPLVIRKKEKTLLYSRDSNVPPGLKSPPGTKLPIGQLVAFFEKDKR